MIILNRPTARRTVLDPAWRRPPDSALGQRQPGAGRTALASLQHALQLCGHAERAVAGRPRLGRSDIGAAVAADGRAARGTAAVAAAAVADADPAGAAAGDGECGWFINVNPHVQYHPSCNPHALAQAARQNLERLPRRQAHPVASTSSSSVIGGAAAAGGVPTMAAVVAGTASAAGVNGAMAQAQHGVVSASSLGGREISITSNPLQMAVAAAAAAAAASSANAAGAAGGGGGGNQSQFLLTRFMTPTLLEAERADMERSRADR